MTVAARRPAFVNDLETCVGCHACAVACANENQLAPGTSWRHIVTINESRRPGLPTFHLSLACNHCRDAPCMTYCPALAIARDPQTGAVLIDDASCIGCRYCSWVCPYDAPRFDTAAGVMQKCTLCSRRLAVGLAPACVGACPVGALSLGTPGDAEPTAPAGFPSAGIGPSIRFLPMRTRGASQGATAPIEGVASSGGAVPSRKITSRSEWTLVAFTLVAQVLVGLVLGATVRGTALPVLPTALAGALAAVVSTAHLGRPLRFWRAGLNLRRSWLSREVITWSLFMGVAILAFSLDAGGARLRWIAVAIGLACLACIDRVYAVMARHDRPRLDDVSAVTGGLLVGAASGGMLVAAAVLVAWRCAAFRMRVAATHGGMRPPRWMETIRAAVAVAGLALLAFSPAATLPGLVAIVTGEILDRIAFYDALDIVTPRTHAQRDLAEATHCITRPAKNAALPG